MKLAIIAIAIVTAVTAAPLAQPEAGKLPVICVEQTLAN
jgi:hypothetical protein